MSRFTKLHSTDDEDINDDDHSKNDIEIEDANDTPSINGEKKQNIAKLPVIAYFERWKCCICCKRQNIYNSLMDDNNSANKNKTTTDKAKEALIYEECLDATTDKLVDNSSWVNANMISLAFTTTIFIQFPGSVKDPKNICKNAWIYFFVIFILSITSLFIPKCCVKTDTLRQELKLKKQENDAAESNNRMIELNDCNETQEYKESEEEKQIRMEMKIFLFVEHEVNDLISKFEILTCATLSNTVAMAWRDAAESTLAVITNSTYITTSVYFYYATIMTIVGIYIVVRLNKLYGAKETTIIQYLENKNNTNTDNSERNKLLRFSFIKRCVNLIVSMIKFAIAWSWRLSVDAFIKSIYGETDGNVSPVITQWSYTFYLTLFVSILFAISEDYYIVYPRNVDAQKRYGTNTARITTNDIIYDNLRFVIGMSWFDSLMATIQFSENNSYTVVTIGYWLIAIGGIVLSVVGTHYITKWQLKQKISHKGLTQAMFDTFERFYDPECLLHDENKSDMIPRVLDNTFFEILSVTIYGWGIAGSLSTTKAITWTVYRAVPGWSEILEDGPTDTIFGKENLYVLWICAAICVLITLGITAYVGKLVNVIKGARRKLFKKLKRDKQKQLKQLQRYGPVPRTAMSHGGDSVDSDDIV